MDDPNKSGEAVDKNQPATPPVEPSKPAEPSNIEPSKPAEPVAPAEPTTPASTDSDKVAKLEEQVSNLSIALKKEREEGGKKVEEIKAQYDEKFATLDRMKQAFNPEPSNPDEPESFTKDDVANIVKKEIEEFKQEQTQSQKIEEYNKEIKALEDEWNGEEGKPKYDDQEVLDWQRNNNLTYLSPRQAFLQMKHQEIVDYEVKQKLKDAKPVENVETPGQAPGEHEPVNNESFDKNVKLNTAKAVLEAMNEADKEM